MKNVVIIGRPNVGKSTLFNRLVGKRRAITDPTPGVTRDPISEKWILRGHAVNLTDSGGVKLDLEALDDLVSKKSLSLLDGADAVVFLMDCMEVTPEDQMLCEKLRPYTDKTILAVNKIDDFTREDLIWNYFSYGFQRVVGLSSAHGLGIDSLEDALLGLLDLDDAEDEEARELEEEENKNVLKLAVLGKPNTGKSTLSNLLTGEDLSIVSSIAGTTRDVVKGGFSYKGREFEILDTAGIRRKAKVEEDVEYYSVNRAIKTIDEAHVVLLVIDSAEGLAEQDKKIANLIVRRGKGVVIVMNKIDLLSGMANQEQALEDRVRFLFPILNFAPIQFISAKNATNIAALLDTVLKVDRQLSKRVDTATLNNALAAWGEEYQPPRGTTGHFKVYYGTQISAQPVKFLFFVNRKKDFPAVYVQYLKNCIRKDLGFSSVPVEVDLRERERSTSNHMLGQNAKVRSAEERAEVKPKVKVQKSGGKAKAAPKAKKVGAKAKSKAKEQARSNYNARKSGGGRSGARRKAQQ
ncbi:MAG: ribosome biogenesis GTPase Der [Sphaerochaetaceae bacterium]|nr:ribosome biogenesis GTPase Der [Sphaerochaetaceae bacterium]